MSSDEELHELSDADELRDGSSKRRKYARACDLCRRKKIRCDSSTQPDKQCSHCVQTKTVCTFIEDSKKRGPPKGYVEDLEARCQALERLIKKAAPHIDIVSEVGPSFTQDSWLAMFGSNRRRGGRTSLVNRDQSDLHVFMQSILSPAAPAAPVLPTIPPPPPMSSTPGPRVKADEGISQALLNSDDEEPDYSALPPQAGPFSEHVRGSTDSKEGLFKRFHGKSSGVTLVQAAMTMKKELTGTGPSSDSPHQRMHLREKYWKPSPWERIPSTAYTLETFFFPPDDLMDNLLECSFSKLMIMFPILHRPSFDRDRRAGLHKRDVNFATLLLMVCAVGSRFTDDPRVCVKNAQGEPEWTSAGWAYFAQAMSRNKPILVPWSLTDLQISALGAMYLAGSSAPHAGWLLVGIGLRFAQDIGAHREKVYGPDHPFENQMWKRAFWCLLLIDRMSSTRLGRASALHDEDIDVKLPLEVDDEYYDEVKKEWRQPPGKPSRMTGFNQFIKLQGIVAYTLRTIYSINSSKVPLGFTGSDWESRTVAELDSSLNSWLDEVPDYLKWDPNIPDIIFRQQAAVLRLTYHYVQITVHRKFIPVLSRGKTESPLSFPSLAICTNAARASSRILEADMLTGHNGSPLGHISAFTCGTVLLLGIWDAKRRNLRVDVSRQMEDVHRCLKVLQYTEERWHSAGRLRDILLELASVNEPPRSQPVVDESRKRGRDIADLNAATARTSISGAPVGQGSLNRAPAQMQQPFVFNNQVPQVPTGTYPISTGGPTVLAYPSNNPADFGPMDWNTNQQPLTTPWGGYQLGPAEIPGMDPNMARVPGLSPADTNSSDVLSPTSVFQGLLDLLNQPVEATAPDPLQGATANPDSWLNQLTTSPNPALYSYY